MCICILSVYIYTNTPFLDISTYYLLVCIHTHIYICIHICTHKHDHTRVYVSTHAHVYITNSCIYIASMWNVYLCSLSQHASHVELSLIQVYLQHIMSFSRRHRHSFGHRNQSFSSSLLFEPYPDK